MKFTRTIAILLSVCLLAALPISASAASAPCDCGEVLQVEVKGYLRPLRYNQGGSIEIPALLGHLLMDKQGKSILPATMHWSIDPAQDHCAEPEYEFVYDYRIDAFVAAAQLNDFIEALCDMTGHGKVALIGKSYGANVLLAYLKTYGPDRLDTFILSNGAFQGASLIVDLLKGRHAMTGPALLNVLESLGPESTPLMTVVNFLRKTPLMSLNLPLAGLSWVLSKTLIPMMMRFPSAWTMIPGAYYDELRPLLDSDPDFAYLRESADRFHNEVRTQAADLILGAKNAGVKVAIVASYGKAPLPVMQNTAYQCDFVMDVAYSSGGAIVAPMGQTLPPGKSKYRSPDGIIDAATCILPDQTWFIKYNDHFTLPQDLQQWIVHSKAQPSITTNPEFPQYLRIFSDGSTTPLNK